jgi:hypothetical protein
MQSGSGNDVISAPGSYGLKKKATLYYSDFVSAEEEASKREKKEERWTIIPRTP